MRLLGVTSVFGPDGRLADAVRRKRDKKKAIKIVARKIVDRKMVNVVWCETGFGSSQID